MLRQKGFGSIEAKPVNIEHTKKYCGGNLSVTLKVKKS